MPEPLDTDKFDEFLEMAFKPSKNQSCLMLWCEECEDITVVTKGAARCGHMPKQFKEIIAWAEKRRVSKS